MVRRIRRTAAIIVVAVKADESTKRRMNMTKIQIHPPQMPVIVVG